MQDFNKLAASKTIEDKIKAAQDPECPAEALDKIVMDGDIPWGTPEANELMNAIASNPNCPAEHLSSIYENPADAGQRLLVLQNPSCPGELMNKAVAGDEGREWNGREWKEGTKLKQAVLKHPALSADVVLACVKTESIGSDLITAIAERKDLDVVTLEIVDLKVKLAELRTQHKEESGYALLVESLLSITDWGRDVFEALYKDEDEHICSAVAKNPSLPEEMLSELIEDTESSVKLSALANPSCTKTILKRASEDTENYSSSRVRKAVALNTKTPKAVLNKLLKDEYRWVREAAASNELVNDKDISDLVKNGDRYILKGIIENPNATAGVKNEISEMLKDEKKYPVETDKYVIETNSWCSEYVGGSMTVEEMADAITEHDHYELPGDWYQYDDIYHNFGDYYLHESVCLPDGTSESLNLEITSSITDNGTDFVMSANTDESGEVDNYELELENLFDPDKVTIDEYDGLVHGYNYVSASEPYVYFEGDPEGESIEGDGYATPSLEIQVKAGGFYVDFDLSSEISVMEEKGIDVSDAEAVLKYLKVTYGL